jgi:hypothetical protein
MRSALWTVAALCLLSGRRVLCDEVAPGPAAEAAERSHPGLVAVDASDVRAPRHNCGLEETAANDSQPQYLVYEVRQLEVVLADDAGEHPPGKPDTERHLQEKEQLLQRLEKKHGTWNEHHARHRLLEALRGFSAYAETQKAELHRLKGLYSHVSKKQKKVCACNVVAVFLSFADPNKPYSCLRSKSNTAKSSPTSRNAFRRTNNFATASCKTAWSSTALTSMN